MTLRPAYDVPVSYNGTTVWLRPSLRAAMTLESLHKGFPELLAKVQQGDTATLRTIVTSAAPDRSAANVFLNAIADAPLSVIQNTLQPAALVLTKLLTTPDDTGEAAKAQSKPVPWADLFAQLFKFATGWLGWSSEEAWNATVPEIMTAFDGYKDKLKATHGAPEDEDEPTRTGMTDAERQAIIDAGADPEFDRQGLQALRAKL